MSDGLPTQNEFRSLASWVNAPNRIGLPVLIDGYMLAGKTYLAEALAAEIGGQPIDADKYLERRQEVYIPSLDVSALQAAFKKANRPILSGVCMRQIHQLLGKPRCLHVYVKRMASWGWADEDELLGEFSEWREDELNGASRVVFEVRFYHRLWTPHEIAEFIYERH